MRRWVAVAAGVIIWVLLLCLGVGAQEMPKADRRASEVIFMMAYRDLLGRRYWSSLANISGALKKDTYFVDLYFLRSVVQRRMGNLDDAAASLRSYLEVRRNDYRGKSILRSLEDEIRSLRLALRPKASMLSATFVDARDGSVLPKLDRTFILGMGGAGKVSSLGDKLFLVDSLGDRVVIYRGGKRLASLAIKSPVAVVPLDYLNWVVLSSDGGAFRVEENQYSGAISQGPYFKHDGHISDGVALSDGAFAVTDRISGSLLILSSGGRVMGQWRPKGSGRLPELVAVDSLGSRLAVADRGRGMVYVLDWTGGSSFKEVANVRVNGVRDLTWNHEGGLFVVAEGGALFKVGPLWDGTVTLDTVARGLKDPWTVCTYQGGIMLLDQGGRQPLWGGLIYNDGAVNGLFGVMDMAIDEGDVYSLTMTSRLSPFFASIGDRFPVVRGVWQNKLALVSVSGSRRLIPEPQVVALESPDGDPSRLWRDIRAREEKGMSLPQVLLLNSNVRLGRRDQERLLAYCLMNGLRLDVAAIGVPSSPELDAVRRLTGGSLYFRAKPALTPLDGVEWTFRMPLPKVDVPLGNVSDSLVSLFVDAEDYSFREWMPFFPAAFR
jgi:hypothetical protein